MLSRGRGGSLGDYRRRFRSMAPNCESAAHGESRTGVVCTFEHNQGAAPDLAASMLRRKYAGRPLFSLMVGCRPERQPDWGSVALAALSFEDPKHSTAIRFTRRWRGEAGDPRRFNLQTAHLAAETFYVAALGKLASFLPARNGANGGRQRVRQH